MSIITKALKKAEQERVSNSFKKMEDIAIRATETDMKTSRILPAYRQGRRPTPKPVRGITPLLYLLAVLIVAATTATFIRFDRGPEASPERTAALTTEPLAENTSAPSDGTTIKKRLVIDDFMKNGKTPSATKPALPSLNGIMYSSTSPQALINGEVVLEGDKIGNFFVFQIFPDKVRLTSESGAVDLKLQ